MTDFEDHIAFDPVPRNSGEWRTRGNDLFRENKLILAREAYFLSRKACKDEGDSNGIPIDLDLLQVDLNLGYYDSVIEKAAKLSGEYEALFLKGKAHYALRGYRSALLAFQNAIELLEKAGKLESEECKDRVKEIKEELKRAETRVEEEGDCSIDRLVKESEENPFKEIDRADFHVPMTKTKISKHKGLSLVLDREVKKGDVVMISKSLASAFRNERDIEKDVTEMEKNELRAKLVSKLTKLALKNPESFESKLSELDALKFKRELTRKWFFVSDEKGEPVCEVDKINDICVDNHIILYRAESRVKTGFGLFYLPSFLNHSCEPNVYYECFYDVIVAYALKDMAAKTELTVSYVSLDSSYQERTELLKALGVVCTCPKCVKKI